MEEMNFGYQKLFQQELWQHITTNPTVCVMIYIFPLKCTPQISYCTCNNIFEDLLERREIAALCFLQEFCHPANLHVMELIEDAFQVCGTCLPEVQFYHRPRVEPLQQRLGWVSLQHCLYLVCPIDYDWLDSMHETAVKCFPPAKIQATNSNSWNYQKLQSSNKDRSRKQWFLVWVHCQQWYHCAQYQTKNQCLTSKCCTILLTVTI